MSGLTQRGLLKGFATEADIKKKTDEISQKIIKTNRE